MNDAVKYLEDQFEWEWEVYGIVSEKDGIRHFAMGGSDGHVHVQQMIKLKDDTIRSLNNGHARTMRPIPSIPSTVREWEDNMGRRFFPQKEDDPI